MSGQRADDLTVPISGGNARDAQVEGIGSAEQLTIIAISEPALPWASSRRPLATILRVALALLAATLLLWLILFVTKGRFLKHPFERLTASLSHRTVKVAAEFQLYFERLANAATTLSRRERRAR